MRVRQVGLGWVSVLSMGAAHAAGFALVEQNASGLGNAYAGQAAVAEDASTVFFNPAGLTRLEGREVVGAIHLIAPSAKFSGSAAYGGGPSPVVATGGDAGKPAVLPNFYYSMKLNPDISLGLGINAPFGLATKYDTPWAGMTQTVYSHIKTINLNPALAWKLTDRLSVGAGLDWQTIDATLSKSASPAVFAEIKMTGEDQGSLGWNLGSLLELDDSTRVGVSYRSRIKHRLEGHLLTPLPPVVNVDADFTLPDTASLSLFRRLNERVDLLADATWTGWGCFDKLEVKETGTGTTRELVPEDWQNVWRFSLGANFHLNEKWTLRGGLAYDQTPVPNASRRTPRIPDEDRTWLAVGGQYRHAKASRLDFGYAHLFVRDTAITHTEPFLVPGPPSALVPLALTGTYTNHVDILSVQYTHSF